MTWMPPGEAALAIASMSCWSGWLRLIVTSAPRGGSSLSTCALRPRTMTFPAPKRLAICTASLPAAPVAPTNKTVSPFVNCARVNASQEVKPGLNKAAAVRSSRRSGIGKILSRRTTQRSAIVERAHSVYAGDLREDVGAPRLRTARLCSDKRMQPGGANVHAHFPLARRWLREVFKARRLPQRMDDSSFHKEILSSLFKFDAMGAQALVPLLMRR